MNYVVISPVKDEELFVEQTLQSMVRQTVKPVQWVIVDDGSSDTTPDIIERYRIKHSFIQVVHRPRGEKRQPGSAVIQAFNCGYAVAKKVSHDFVVKLDCDLSFESDYFARLLMHFQENPKLGIASGIYFEKSGDVWKEIKMPWYHAAGAAKMVRVACFESINGFIARRSWDTVDEIKAISYSWQTAHFPELKMKHLKPEGIGIGQLPTAAMHGEIYYLTGGGILFFMFKVLNRMGSRPFIAGGFFMLWGYLRALLQRQDRLVTNKEAACYRVLLANRITDRLKQLLKFS